MEIVSGVHQVEGMGPWPWNARAFLLVDERLTLVDTGSRGDSGAIERYIRDIGRRMEELEMVVLTHHHTDHTGSLPDLRRHHRFLVAAHEAEIPYVEGRVPEATARVGGLAGAALRLIRPFLRVEPVVVDIPLRDGSVLDVLGGVQVVHLPGHTEGSICLYLPQRRLAFVGDAFSIRRRGVELPPAMFTEDMEQARRSLARLLPLELQVIIPSHAAVFRGDVSGKIREFLERR